MPDKVESDVSVANDEEIARPYTRLVEKGLVLATVGDQAILPKDDIGGFDPHVSGVTPVLQETTLTLKGIKEKGLYPNLNPLHLH